MRLSHSKLSLILSNPMEYFLNYKMGIYPKATKPAFMIGSAVHWGLEHSTDDLTEYFKQEGTLTEQSGFTPEQLLVESMVHGYLQHKQELFDQALTDDKTGEKAKLLNESHELWVEGLLKSKLHPLEPYKFVGQIDLLLLTDKGFVLIDYKTSTFRPNWDNYLDQIYRYIFLLKANFPDTPIFKIGIINLRKTGIRIKKGENDFSFKKRLQLEYEVNDDELICFHGYDPRDLKTDVVNDYIDNLSTMADTADMIDSNGLFFTNYAAVNGPYKSQYWDIFYHTPDAWNLYGIKDKIFDKSSNKIFDSRDCKPLDMLVIDHQNVLDKYEQFKAQALAYYTVAKSVDKDEFFKHLKKAYITDDELLEKYWETFLYELENDKK